MSDEQYREVFAKKFKYYMDLNNKTQADLINDLGISSSTISNWYTGQKLPRMGKIQMLADYFGINKSDLIEEKNENHSRTGIRIPVLGYVAAGIPMDAIEYILDYEEIPQEMAKSGEYFALKIKGDSMEPRICDGDIVIVRKQPDVNNGEIAIVLVNGYEATCKKITKNESGINLVPLNTSGYEVMFYSNEQIYNLPVTILGKVVELRSKF